MIGQGAALGFKDSWESDTRLSALSISMAAASSNLAWR